MYIWERSFLKQLKIIAWEIPWTEKPGELQSMALQRVRHWSEVRVTQSCPTATLSGFSVHGILQSWLKPPPSPSTPCLSPCGGQHTDKQSQWVKAIWWKQRDNISLDQEIKYHRHAFTYCLKAGLVSRAGKHSVCPRPCGFTFCLGGVFAAVCISLSTCGSVAGMNFPL